MIFYEKILNDNPTLKSQFRELDFRYDNVGGI